MSRVKFLIIIAAVLALDAGLGALRPANRAGSSGHSPAADDDGATRQKPDVVLLPATCHLTCPVTDYASRTSQVTRSESRRLTDFPTVADSVKSTRLDATLMFVPSAMKMREQGVPFKTIYPGHRDGSTVLVRLDAGFAPREIKQAAIG